MYNFRVFYFLDNDFFFFQKLIPMPKVNPWADPQPKPFFFKFRERLRKKLSHPLA